MKSNCPFCSLPHDRIICENEHAFAIRDVFAVSPGHSLIIPKRHVGSFFETTTDEKRDLLALLDVIKSGDKSYPDGYNIGINDGIAAGQTIMHLHIHLIPRYHGDMEDPRGGVRWVIPDKAKYW